MKTYSYLEMLTILLAQEAGKPSVKFSFDDDIGRERTIWRDTTNSKNPFVEGIPSGFGQPYNFTEADIARTYRDYVEPEIGEEIEFGKMRPPQPRGTF